MRHRHTIAAVLLWAAAIGGIASCAYREGQQHPPCLEDEVMAVQHDPDPSHGLTWACEALDDLLEAQR